MIFCDTSAAAKLYVPEPESATVQRRLESEDGVCLSELARTELLAVFHRRWREGKWRRTEFLAAVRQFSRDDLTGFWTWLPMDRSITEAAAQVYTTLPEKIFLRSSDCLHLVTAMQNSFGEICTYDSHQISAASALGLKAVTA
jgi:predicted nucleic acid-binding protein